MMNRSLLFVLVLCLCAVRAVGQTPCITTPQAIDYQTPFLVGNTSFFQKFDPLTGNQLWKGDAGFQNPQLVKAIGGYPDATKRSAPFFIGTFTSYASKTSSATLNGFTYFAATDPINGRELWKTDGTAAGTVLVKDINPGTNSTLYGNPPIDSSPYGFFVVNGVVCFYAGDPNGLSLWKTDGTAAGTVKVMDRLRSRSIPVVLNGVAYFSAILLDTTPNPTYTYPTELWKTDGTTGGTTRVKDIYVGSQYDEFVADLTLVNGTIFFSARTALGRELWKTDGTDAGTVLVKDIKPGATDGILTDFTNRTEFTALNGILYFFGRDANDVSQLWRSDGTDAGTVPVTSIFTDNNTLPSYVYSQMINVNGTLFFAASDAAHGKELWKSDGTTAGTVLIKDIFVSSQSYQIYSSQIAGLTSVNGIVYFTATTEGTSGGSFLWKSDGTTAGTVSLFQSPYDKFTLAAYNLTPANGLLYFGASITIASGTSVGELFKTDGTVAGTALVKKIGKTVDAQGKDIGSNPQYMVNANGVLLFSANDGFYGDELYRSDGTAAGTNRIKDINVGYVETIIKSQATINGAYYFVANTDANGEELWKSDGTTAGTTILKDINPGTDNGAPANLLSANNVLYFTANDGVNGTEVWKSDGTTAGTVLLKDIYPGAMASVPNSSSATGFIQLGTTVFFNAKDGTNGRELWKTDGTTAGTLLVKDINPGTGDSDDDGYSGHRFQPVTLNNMLYFGAADYGPTGAGYELWRSDGTAAGTTQVADIYAGRGGSLPTELTVMGANLYFLARTSSSRNQIWKSDGTQAGTTVLKAFPDGAYGAGWLTVSNGALFFAADNTGNGTELWKSDGTPTGTVLLKAFCTGSYAGNPTGLTDVNGLLYFRAGGYNCGNGNTLWSSNGTTAGTVSVTSISGFNPTNAGPNKMTNVGNTLFLRAQVDGNIYSYFKVIPPIPPAPPTLQSSATGAITNGSSVTLTAGGCTGGSTLSWFGTGGSVVVSPIGTTQYVATCNYGSQCPSAPASLTVTVTAACSVSPVKVDNIPAVVFNGVSYFAKSDAATGIELWKGDANGNNAVLVKDINTNANTTGSSPAYLTVSNNTLYFTANDGINGLGLWKSDGTANGTVLLKSGAAQTLTDVNGILYFIIGFDLWKTDGTTTTPVYQNGNSVLLYLTNVNGTVYFTKSNQLWKSNGTTAGTAQVRAFTSIQNLASFNGMLFFSASDGTGTSEGNTELWKSDGTLAGTALLNDINAGNPGSSPDSFKAINGLLYFQTHISNIYPDRAELWRTDGTTAGTIKLQNLTNTNNAVILLTLNNKLIFKGFDATNGDELWQSDGSVAGTVLIKDINPGSAGSTIQLGTRSGAFVYFMATDGTNGYALWKSDGTPANTVTVKSFGSGPNIPYLLTDVNGTLFFRFYQNYQNTFWKSDGTDAGTISIGNLTADNITNFNGTAFFRGDDSSGPELWKSNGTAAGTVLAKKISANNANSLPDSFTIVNGTVVFQADDGGGRKLWRTDGSPGGTVPEANLFVPPSPVVAFNGVNYFVTSGQFVNNQYAGNGLFRTDGTVAGTVLISNAPTILGNLTKSGNALYFSGYYQGAANNLWTSDGTTAGTQVLGNISPDELIDMNGTLFFRGGGTNHAELWKATSAGTVRVKVIDASNSYSGSYPNSFRVMNNVLYFIANDGVSGNSYELWRSDGTDAGTVKVKSLSTSTVNGIQLQNVGGVLFFVAKEATNGDELWRSDGTTAGTVLVKDIRPGSTGSSITGLRFYNGRMIFSANDGTTGQELWQSDGTATGTTLLSDLFPGSASSSPGTYPNDYFQLTGTNLFFGADDGTNAKKWRLATGAGGTVTIAISAQSGDWNTASTWVCGGIPTAVSAVQIKTGHVVTISSAVQARQMQFESGAKIQYNTAGRLVMSN